MRSESVRLYSELRIPHSELSSGFTLVELLLASTMMAVLVVGLSAHLRGGLTVWHRVTSTTESLQRQRVGLERLERDLANGMLYDGRPDVYGEEIGEAPPPQFTASSAAWYTAGPASASQLPAVRFVRYACAARDGVQGMWRLSQSIGQARAHAEPDAEMVIPGCESLALRYAVQAPPDQPQAWTWSAVWTEPERRLPRLVEVSIRLVDGRRLTRLFTIPTGTIPPAQESPSMESG